VFELARLKSAIFKCAHSSVYRTRARIVGDHTLLICSFQLNFLYLYCNFIFPLFLSTLERKGNKINDTRSSIEKNEFMIK